MTSALRSPLQHKTTFSG